MEAHVLAWESTDFSSKARDSILGWPIWEFPKIGDPDVVGSL